MNWEQFDARRSGLTLQGNEIEDYYGEVDDTMGEVLMDSQAPGYNRLR